MTTPAPRQVAETWNPRHERNFERTWLSHLIMHAGQWCHASDVWEPRDDWQRIVLRQKAWEVVEAARRLGLCVESDAVLGYRVTGHAGLPKYLHLRQAPIPQGPDGSGAPQRPSA